MSALCLPALSGRKLRRFCCSEGNCTLRTSLCAREPGAPPIKALPGASTRFGAGADKKSRSRLTRSRC